MTNFYKIQKEKKLKANSMSERNFLTYSTMNQDIKSEKNLHNEENFLERKMQHFAIETSQTENNISNEEKIEICKKENPQNFQRDNFLFLRGKNLKAEESATKFKISPLNTFRMRASHIMTLNNDLINDDKLSSLNYLKVKLYIYKHVYILSYRLGP